MNVIQECAMWAGASAAFGAAQALLTSVRGSVALHYRLFRAWGSTRLVAAWRALSLPA